MKEGGRAKALPPFSLWSVGRPFRTETCHSQVRAWSFWEQGPRDGLPITSHHQYPDDSMCVCIPYQWIRGRDYLLTYVNFCVCWIAKSLHRQLIGFYPGLQHLPPRIRRAVQVSDDYCGCGRPMRYASCCQKNDLRLTDGQLEAEAVIERSAYASELKVQQKPFRPIGKDYQKLAWHREKRSEML